MPMITSGSPKEPENERQDAGQSQVSCSIRDAMQRGTNELSHSSLLQMVSIARRSLSVASAGLRGRAIRRSPSFAGMSCSLPDIADALDTLTLPQPLELLEGHDGFQTRSLEPLQ
jgi:hypothetical protein